VQYRGELTSDEGAMIRRAFLKGFMKNTSSDVISFVNAEQKAVERHIQVTDVNDPGFSDYPSAIRFEIGDGKETFSVAGVVFGANNYRLSQVNEFNFEVIPEGHLLSMINIDRPGVIGDLGTLLAKNGVNISQFELSRNMPGGKAMALIRVDSSIDQPVLEALRAIRNMVSVRLLTI
jgi:D-3-phosphoglycerate dehydrogenase